MEFLFAEEVCLHIILGTLATQGGSGGGHCLHAFLAGFSEMSTRPSNPTSAQLPLRLSTCRAAADAVHKGTVGPGQQHSEVKLMGLGVAF